MGPGWQVYPKNGTKYFSAGYFLKVEKDLPVFAVHDGQIIDTYFAFILDDYRIVCGDTLNEVIDLANNKYKKYGIQPDDFMCGVWFDIGNGEKITYRGLSVTKFPKLKECVYYPICDNLCPKLNKLYNRNRSSFFRCL